MKLFNKLKWVFIIGVDGGSEHPLAVGIDCGRASIWSKARVASGTGHQFKPCGQASAGSLNIERRRVVGPRVGGVADAGIEGEVVAIENILVAGESGEEVGAKAHGLKDITEVPRKRIDLRDGLAFEDGGAQWRSSAGK